MSDSTLDRLVISVTGRPAPQGSKHKGAHGQLREASVYLPAWRAAVKRDTYKAYVVAGIDPAALPLLRGPVGFSAVFRMPAGVPIDGPPDLDKLIRSTWDALGRGTEKRPGARLWEDDARVVHIHDVHEVHVRPGEQPGADIEVWRVTT